MLCIRLRKRSTLFRHTSNLHTLARLAFCYSCAVCGLHHMAAPHFLFAALHFLNIFTSYACTYSIILFNVPKRLKIEIDMIENY